jgi:glycosyltransferase involved in cell wall biosynthesis
VAKLIWHSCCPWAPSGYGGQTALWLPRLQEMGHEVTVSSYWGIQGAPTSWRGIDILPGFGPSYCSVSLRKHCEMVQPDLVITLGDVWVTDPGIMREMPVAHWLPCDCRPMSMADRSVVEASGAQVIAMSRFGYQRFREAGFSPVYVPHGIDTEVFRPLDRDALRDKHGLCGKFVIGINGANNDAIRKGHPEQMLAFAKFRSAHPDAVLALHTGVHQEGGQDLEAVAENLGILDVTKIVDQYRYTAGYIQPAEIAEWYNIIDVLLECSYGEGFGLPVLEAQACGVPVIATDASAMTELSPHGWLAGGEPFWNGVHRAWWIRPSVREMVRALEQAYERKDEVPREKLREFACEYDISVVAGKYMEPAIGKLLEHYERNPRR